jgi:CheY-like chemotaxis protein
MLCVAFWSLMTIRISAGLSAGGPSGVVFRVSIADGVPDGLAALDTTRFDLMIVDIFMPDMRGFESIRVFHNHAPTVPLIVISGSAFSGPELKCLSEAEPHPRHVATLDAVTNARSEPQRRMKSSDRSKDEALAG